MTRHPGWVVLALLLACGGAPDASAPLPGDELLGHDGSLDAVTGTLELSTSGVRVLGRLEAGKRARVQYSPARLPQCRGEQGGIPQWTVTGFWRVDGGATTSFPVTGLNAPRAAPELTFPNGAELELRVKRNNLRFGGPGDPDVPLEPPRKPEDGPGRSSHQGASSPSGAHLPGSPPGLGPIDAPRSPHSTS